MRTSPNIWLVFDGLRERTRKVPAAWREKRIHVEETKKVRNGKEGKKIRKEGWGKRIEEMEARAKVHERSGGWAVRAGECRAFLLVPASALLETREADQPDRRIVESDLVCAYIPFPVDTVCAKVKEGFGNVHAYRRSLRRIWTLEVIGSLCVDNANDPSVELKHY